MSPPAGRLEKKPSMRTLLRMALWTVAGVLAVLAIARFMLIEFDQDEDGQDGSSW